MKLVHALDYERFAVQYVKYDTAMERSMNFDSSTYFEKGIDCFQDKVID